MPTFVILKNTVFKNIMEIEYKIPLYAKAALVFISIIALIFTLYEGQHIIIPLLYATIIAILLNPFMNFLMRHGFSKVIAISMAVALATIVALGIFYVVSSQITMVSETYPRLRDKFNIISAEIVHWVSIKFKIRETNITSWLVDTENDTINKFAIGEKLTEAGRIMVTIMLLPVYIYLMLFYKHLLLDFIRKIFRSIHHIAVVEVLINAKKIIQDYLVGLFFELIIIAVLNSAGLLLLNIDYAIFLGITGAILNIIPYFGGILAIALPMIIAFVTKDSYMSSVMVFAVYVFIQFIDNHLIIPHIVSSRVKINALVSVVAVLIGDAIWGIPGMFLSIPVIAVLKVIFDHIEPLKPYGFLLGNIVPTSHKFNLINNKRVSQKDLVIHN